MDNDNDNLRSKGIEKNLEAPTEDSIPDLSKYYTESIGEESAPISLEDIEIDPNKLGIQLTTPTQEKYSSGSEIGKGAMKQILRVKDHDTARNVAMAVIQNINSQARVKRFVYEARIAANLEHPNIIPIHDIGLDESGTPYFTMKLVKGETLSEILENLSLNNPDYVNKYDFIHLLDIFKKICDAIAFAHSKGIVHLDLKPENILVGQYGEVLVLDWGLAKIINKEDFFATKQMYTMNLFKQISIESTVHGAVKGTPGYMAPEQAAGQNTEKDQRTDIYALGAILYSILTYTVPIDDDDILSVLSKTIRGDIIPPSKRNKKCQVPKALEAVVMKAMKREPYLRYQEVGHLINDIDAFITGFATTAEKASYFTHLFLLIKRHKVEFTLSTCSLVIIFSLVGSFLFQIQLREQAALLSRSDAIEARIKAENEKMKVTAEKNQAIHALNKLKALNQSQAKIINRLAPDFIDKAQQLIQDKSYNEAFAAIETALVLDHSLTSAWLLKGRLLLGKENFTEAIKAFSKAQLPSNNALVQLSQKYNKLIPLSDKQKLSLVHELTQAGETMTAVLLEIPSHQLDSLLKSLKAAIQKKNPEQKELSLEIQKTNGNININLSNNKLLTDISALQDLPVNELNLSNTAVSDLTPLKNMPLKQLNIAHSKVQDLSPLKGLPLQGLNTCSTLISDISPLKGLPLTKLVMNSLPLSDITPLQGMPLEELEMAFSNTTDLSPLSGMSLHYLNLQNAQHVKDITALKDLPLKRLNISGTQVTSLLPLQNISLHELNAEATPITSLTPLQNMPICKLNIADTRITNITPLAQMPLKTLNLCNCINLKDISPLKANKTLTDLTLPPHAQNILFLKKLPHLKSIGYNPPGSPARCQTLDEFWEDYLSKKNTSSKQ